MNSDPEYFRLVVDLQAAQTEGSAGRGIGRYSLALTRKLAELGAPYRLSICLNKEFPESAASIESQFRPLLGDAGVCAYPAPSPSTPWSGTIHDVSRLAGERIARKAWAGQRPDVLHVSSVFEAFHGRSVVPSLSNPAPGVVVSATAYDLIPLIFSDVYLSEEATRNWYYSKLERLRRCDLLLSISEATRADIIDRLGFDPSRVINISGAVDDMFKPGEVNAERMISLATAYGLSKPYVLYTGGIDHRKNVELLIEAFALLSTELRSSYQLAIVCNVRDVDRARLKQLAKSCGLSPGALVLTGFVSDEDLVDLYRACRLFVFPSMYEGFGLPVLEAMACGAPTIAANTSSLPEIVGSSEALFQIGSREQVAAAMVRALSDAPFREHLREHGLARARLFSWDRTAKAARAAWCEAIKRKHHASTTLVKSRRRRLALVSPLLPQRSGIADFVSELLPHLAEHFEIDLFAAEGVDRARYRRMGYVVRSWQELLGCWTEYDAGVLYQFGNSEFHEHMLALVECCPGVVHLHDAFLSGLATVVEYGPRQDRGFFEAMLAYCHGAEAVLFFKTHGLQQTVDKFPMSRWVADRATGVVVTSNHARDLLLHTGQLEGARCCVVQHQREVRPVTDETRVAARRAIGIDHSTLLVASFGFPHERKLSIELANTWTRVRHRYRAQLAFVGDALGDYGVMLKEIASRAPKASPIHITGYLGDSEFHNYLIAADVVVQLRDGSRGEASGAALYAMAYGRPVIASKHGSLAEIPSEACIHVESPLRPEELSSTLEELLQDASLRSDLGRSACEWVRRSCDPKVIALELASYITRANFQDCEPRATDGDDLFRVWKLVGDSSLGPWAHNVEQALNSIQPAGLDAAARERLHRSVVNYLRDCFGGVPEGTHSSSDDLVSAGAFTIAAADDRIHTVCGEKNSGILRSTGAPGVLMYGPYISVPRGSFRVRVFGHVTSSTPNCGLLQVAYGGGAVILCEQSIPQSSWDGLLARVDFSSNDDIAGLEVRVIVDANAELIIEGVDIVRLA